MDTLYNDIKVLIIEALALEDITPDDIVDDEALFGDGLGLDSIDALELGVALKKKYQITIEGDDENAIKEHFSSVKALASYIHAQTAA